MTVIEAVRALRYEFGESQEAFARRAGVTVRSMAYYETRRTPSSGPLLTLRELANVRRRPDLAAIFAQALTERIRKSPPAQAKIRETALRAFFNEIWECHTGMIEGCDIEDIAERLGLACRVLATERCEEEPCACEEFGFPIECLRPLPAFTNGPEKTVKSG